MEARGLMAQNSSTFFFYFLIFFVFFFFYFIAPRQISSTKKVFFIFIFFNASRIRNSTSLYDERKSSSSSPTRQRKKKEEKEKKKGRETERVLHFSFKLSLSLSTLVFDHYLYGSHWSTQTWRKKQKKQKKTTFWELFTMRGLSKVLLFVCELFLSSIIHLLFGFYIFSTAVTADVSQTLVGSIRASNDCVNEETRIRESIHGLREGKAFSGTNSVPPIVLVHGIFGFGKGVWTGFSLSATPSSRVCVCHFYWCAFVLLM